ncbi:MAG TPA: hypothetical protein VEU51_08690 [Candidatus Acidoferrales bacterium]|nr:hypothetical protein [Candidatus Acidoferrales bacterium]
MNWSAKRLRRTTSARPDAAWRAIAGAWIATLATLALAACSKPAPVKAPPRIYASAEEVELDFRSRTFILGTNNEVAEVRAVGWPRDKVIRLPFWFGVNILVPGVMAPKEGDFYVISEATLTKQLDTPGEWMIEAGSSLVQQETVFVTTRTKYLGTGKILPTIVQYMGKREFKTADGKPVMIPVLREVSLPMKWTLGGGVPAIYARYRV